MHQPDLPDRVTKLEREMAVVWGHATAARTLASGADHDVANHRVEMQLHTRTLNALRDTQLEHGDLLREHGRFHLNHTAGLAEHSRFHLNHTARLATLSSDMVEVKADIGGLKSDVAGLKSDVAGLKSDVAGLKSDMVEVKSRLDDVTLRLDDVTIDLKEVRSGVERITVLLTAGKEAGQQG